LQPPRNYQALHAANLRAPQEPASHVEKQEAPSRALGTGQKPEPHRPEQVRVSTGRMTDSGGMEAQQALANDLMKQNRANASIRQEARPDMSASSPSAVQKNDKGQLGADLKEARESTSASVQARDQSRAPDADKAAAQPDASTSRERTGKAALAADLKDAKDNAPSQQQARDQSRSR
jgi:hypothetical protein